MNVLRCLALFSLVALPVHPQSPLEESSVTARAIVERALSAIGGQDALRKLPAISRTLTGYRVEIGQAFDPAEKYTTQPLRITSTMEPATGRSVEETSTSIIGGLHIRFRQIVRDRTTAYTINLDTKTWAPLAAQNIGGGRSTPYRYPEVLLPLALSRAETLRFLGQQVVGGRRQNVVGFADAYGLEITLFFDAETGRLTKSERLMDEPVFSLAGPQSRETIYSDYRIVGDLTTPFGYTTRYGGEVLDEMQIETISVDEPPPATAFDLPKGMQQRPTLDAPAAQPLADGVYAVRASYNTMFVVFEEYVLVIEAGGSEALSEAVIGEIRKAAPGKPIRYVVATHYHHDHLAGIRRYVAEGATIVGTPATILEIQRLTEARRRIQPDAFERLRPRLSVEKFTRTTVFSDERQRVEVYDIGPNPHVKELAIVWVPSAKTVYVADALDLEPGEPQPARADTIAFAEQLRALGLEVTTIIPAHGRFGTIADLETALSLARSGG